MKALYLCLLSAHDTPGEVFAWADSEDEAKKLAFERFKERYNVPDYLSGLMTAWKCFDADSESFATVTGGFIFLG